MKICIAQTKSHKGKIKKNTENHLLLIHKAIEAQADLIVFPELSITNYEPYLAKKFISDTDDSVIKTFQESSDKNAITICVGMPTSAVNEINISMLIFQPNKEMIVYSKKILHTDELLYFICGSTPNLVEIKGTKIAFGICYETLQKEHFTDSIKNGAQVYIASVAKPENGILKAYSHYTSISKEYKTPILMANCVGPCDNFISTGQSAVWSKSGKLIDHLDDKTQGLPIYDTKLETSKIYQTKITQGNISDLQALFTIYQNAKIELERTGIYQWTTEYPNISITENDIKNRVLYVMKNGDDIIGAINISEDQEKEYELINWKYNDSKVLTIHRLVIDPKYQRKGNAKKLMDFAENFAFENQYTSIRLDAYSYNKPVIEFYQKRNYIIRGDTYFSGRELPFHCMEKKI